MTQRPRAASVCLAALALVGCACSGPSSASQAPRRPHQAPAGATTTTTTAAPVPLPTTTTLPSATPTSTPAPVTQAAGWTDALTELPPGGGFTSLSCLSDTLCVAVGGGTEGDPASLNSGSGVTVSWDGATWSGPSVYFPAPATGPVTAPVLPSLSCTSGPTCVIADGSGHASRGDGTNWSPPVALPPVPALPPAAVDPGAGRTGSRMTAVSCPSPSWCGMVDNTGRAFVLDRGGWGPSRSFGSPTGPGGSTVSLYQPGRVGISCPSPSSCTAVVGAVVLDWDGTGWDEEPFPWTSTLRSGSADATAVSCAPSSDRCVVVNGSGASVRSPGGGWSAEQQIDPGGELDAISCPTTSFCLAADAGGSVVTWDGSSWSAPTRVVPAPTQYPDLGTSVSCPTARFCMVLSGDGDYATYAAPSAP